jgi:hypothetical protein
MRPKHCAHGLERKKRNENVVSPNARKSRDGNPNSKSCHGMIATSNFPFGIKCYGVSLRETLVEILPLFVETWIIDARTLAKSGKFVHQNGGITSYQ